MARLARVVAPGFAHHITQWGNRRQQTFFCDEDYLSYLKLMAEWCGAHKVKILAYCLMPNHVHLIAVPETSDGLRRAIGEVHRRYTRMVNFREGWRGHLWQGRFASFVLDESYLLTAARYVELNPVRAGLIGAPSRYRWSSAAAHRRHTGDGGSAARLGPQLASVARPGDSRGGYQTPACPPDYRSTTGRRGVFGITRRGSRQDSEAPETRPQGTTARLRQLTRECSANR